MRIVSLVYIFFSFLSAAFGFDKKLCLEEYTKYIDQLLIRPHDPRVYLTEAELDQVVSFGLMDNSRLNEAHFSKVHSIKKSENPSDYSHSTNVAALISSKDKSSISPFSEGTQVFYMASDLKGSTYTQEYLQLLRRIQTHNRNSPDNKVRVVNFSIQTPDFSPELKAVFSELEKQDEINLVFAIGNTGDGQKFYYDHETFEYKNVLPVSSVSKTQLIQGTKFGPKVALAGAMVEGIPSVTNVSRYTSFAAPQVSGALLTIHKVNRDLSASVVRGIIKASAQDWGENGRDFAYGYGVPNLSLATALARGLDKKALADLSSYKEHYKGEKLERKIYDYFKKRVKKQEYVQIRLDSIPCSSKDVVNQLIEINSNIKGNRSCDKKSLIWIDEILDSQSCEELSCKLDKIWATHQLSHSNRTSNSLLCGVFMEVDNYPGIKQFCDTQRVLDYVFAKNVGKDMLYAARPQKELKILFKKRNKDKFFSWMSKLGFGMFTFVEMNREFFTISENMAWVDEFLEKYPESIGVLLYGDSQGPFKLRGCADCEEKYIKHIDRIYSAYKENDPDEVVSKMVRNAYKISDLGRRKVVNFLLEKDPYYTAKLVFNEKGLGSQQDNFLKEDLWKFPPKTVVAVLIQKSVRERQDFPQLFEKSLKTIDKRLAYAFLRALKKFDNSRYAELDSIYRKRFGDGNEPGGTSLKIIKK